jgi:methionine biosynthesis protein MetW
MSASAQVSATQLAIAELVPPGSRVLDLGCGNGAMLAHLMAARGCSGYGIEIDDANVQACVKRGVNVIQLNLDEGLSTFEEASFDVVLQIDTLQHLRNAEVMLLETVRVGRLGIVAFPNFAHWPNRLSVLAGRMPVTKRLPYQWFDTPNVHLCTINDFDEFCKNHNIDILERKVITDGKEVNFIPNLLGCLAMYRLKTK